NEGISMAGDLIDTALQYGVMDKSGNSYSYGEVKLGVGRETARVSLRDDKKLMKEIKAKVWDAVNKSDEN
ncbi:DNA recombination/repair protein RecA, partial [Patescibacteria group bacterium]|nr:DNA recombination/repair protein RecA [Patescibacteria group bacterium]